MTAATLPALHFAHANSFPADTYQVYFAALAAHYTVSALPLHAHNPAYPVTDGWDALQRELEDELSACHGAPVILVGHSLGGMLSLMVARARPELVRCVVLLDSPVVAGWRALLLRIAKSLDLDMAFSPARFSVKRRNHWEDTEAAYRHFAAKSMFAVWPEQVLRDYVQHGTVAGPQGVTLRFTREIESAVYRSLPHHMAAVARGKFPVPVGFVGGLDSAECKQAGLAATRRLVGENFVQIPGGHLFPMETPERAAAATHAMIQRLLGAVVSTSVP